MTTLTYPVNYQAYLEKVATNDILDFLRKQEKVYSALILDIPDNKGDFAYAPGKWTVKELIGHTIDTERIMAYRALCFSRNEINVLPGFDENAYVANSNFRARTLERLAEEFKLVRQSNLAMIEGFRKDMIERTGVANGTRFSVDMLLYIMAGHVEHHIDILKERYL